MPHFAPRYVRTEKLFLKRELKKTKKTNKKKHAVA